MILRALNDSRALGASDRPSNIGACTTASWSPKFEHQMRFALRQFLTRSVPNDPTADL